MLFLLTFVWVLCACTPTIKPSERIHSDSTAKLENRNEKSPYSRPSSTYLTQAKNQEGIEKQKSLLLAAGRFISDGQWQQGAAILTHTSDLTPELADEKKILLAQIDLICDRPQSAIIRLGFITDKNELPLYQQGMFHELLATAYGATNKPINSINERIKLESILLDEKSKAKNRRALWLMLMRIPQAELSIISQLNQPVLQGWLELALISHQYRDNPKSLFARLETWKSRFSSHPANYILPYPLGSIAHKIHVQPKRMALLLPLSGALKGPGTAVRDGFMAAYKNNNPGKSIRVAFYDTNKGDVAFLYETAINDGAEYVVGPLTKPQVAAVAALPHPIPTLLLNDTEIKSQENSYSFSLSPVNEAIQVAIRAKNKGSHRALIIAPENAWGNQITKAFTTQWLKGGGRVVDTLLYAAKDDLNKKMKDFLQVSNSQKREERLRLLLGQQINPIVTRRQDFDTIFLLAYPTKARQIMPLLNYYYAGDVPVYATSAVYSGNANPLKDKDLDGVIFCDIPWVFSHQEEAKNWPEQFNSYNRLYALGVDSYALATQLNQLMLFPANKSYSGEGVLYLKSSQKITRVLEWGQFKQGLVHSLGEAV